MIDIKNWVYEHIIAIFKVGDDHAYRGFLEFQKGNFQEAIRQFNIALYKGTKSYNDYDLHTSIGNAYDNLGLYEKAIIAHKESIKIKPEYFRVWANIGITHRKNGDFVEAERCYQESIKLNPNYAEVHSSMASIYIFKNDPENALKHLLRAKELDPSVQPIYSNLALVYAMQGEFEKAEKEIKHAILLGYKSWRDVTLRIKDLKEFNSPGFDPNSFNISEN